MTKRKFKNRRIKEIVTSIEEENFISKELLKK
ncbi:hypothetical protein M947_04940 [Sulfurimonas hongkongensis]|uniref:Uncharacterized protein n=1 Tax=Sulfurimonas hongkongensis TaxID=1172190 RepID=T0JP44_9BACT|nr:hypothetical protein M947_04940 [Sulfurimonas hongkongensis]